MQKTSTKLFLIGLVLAILTAFAYWPVRQHQFVDYDDQLYVTENYIVQQGLNWEGIQWAFTSGYAANWHPLTWISHMLDCELFGTNPGAHHLVSLLLHVVNSLLLLLLLHRLTGALWRSSFVAALFALHPLHVESVAWISERKDVLSGFFGLLSTWFYASYARGRIRVEQGEKSGAARARLDYSLALIFFALGLMAKPMLVTLPFVFLLLDFWPLNRIPLPKIKARLAGLVFEKLPFFALTVASCVVTFIAQKTTGAVVALKAVSLPDRIANALTAYAGYLGKTIWPQKLAAFYPLRTLSAWEIGLASLILLIISVAAMKVATRRQYFLFGWLWYLGMLVPVIGLVQVGNQSMADRYTYLPLIGIFIVLAWGAFDLVRIARFRIALGSIAVAVIAVCAVLARGQASCWQNTEALAEQALRVTGRKSGMMLNLLAITRIEDGKPDEAIALLTDLPEINAEELATLGNALQRVGRDDEAMKAFTKALESDPSNANVQNNIGFFLLEQNKLDESIPHLRAALKSKPDFPQALYNLGTVCFKKGDLLGAISFYEKAVRLWPAYPDAQCNLGMALLKSGKPEIGLPHVEAAIRLNPNFGRAHHHLSEILFQLGRFPEAEAAARRAVELEPAQPLMYYQLALTLNAQKKWAEAEPILRNVLEVAQRAGDQRLANEITQRLASYKN